MYKKFSKYKFFSKDFSWKRVFIADFIVIASFLLVFFLYNTFRNKISFLISKDESLNNTEKTETGIIIKASPVPQPPSIYMSVGDTEEKIWATLSNDNNKLQLSIRTSSDSKLVIPTETLYDFKWELPEIDMGVLSSMAKSGIGTGYQSSSRSRPLAWKNKSKTLVLFIPGHLQILSFKINGNVLNYIDEKQVDLPKITSYPSHSIIRLFFTGDDKKIYIAITSDPPYSYIYDIASEKLTDTGLNYNDSQSAFPMSDSSTLAILVTGLYNSANPDLSQEIILLDGDKKQTIKIPDSKSIDWMGKLVFSPDNRHVCIEWGSSGSWWYELRTFPELQTIVKADSYSYCRRWLDNNHLVVVENRYGSHFTFWKDVNSFTGEKTILDKIIQD